MFAAMRMVTNFGLGKFSELKLESGRRCGREFAKPFYLFSSGQHGLAHKVVGFQIQYRPKGHLLGFLRLRIDGSHTETAGTWPTGRAGTTARDDANVVLRHVLIARNEETTIVRYQIVRVTPSDQTLMSGTLWTGRGRPLWGCEVNLLHATTAFCRQRRTNSLYLKGAGGIVRHHG